MYARALWGLTRNLRKPRNTAKCLPTPSLHFCYPGATRLRPGPGGHSAVKPSSSVGICASKAALCATGHARQSMSGVEDGNRELHISSFYCGSMFRLTAARHSQEISSSAAPSMIWICDPPSPRLRQRFSSLTGALLKSSRSERPAEPDHRIAGCCACAASGQAAAPPSSVMNSRRFS
jgi:hypothetical protein